MKIDTVDLKTLVI